MNSKIESAEYWLSWIRRGRSVAGFCVALGVAGEFVVHRATRSLHANIEAAREVQLADLRASAEKARLAQERLRADNLRLEASIQPRRLNPEQEAEFRNVMAHFPGKKFKLTVTPNDLDGLLLAQQLRTALLDAGWVDSIGKVLLREPDLILGVALFPDDSVNDIAVYEFSERLKASKILITRNPAYSSRDGQTEGTLEVRIGVKPPPEMMTTVEFSNICLPPEG